MGKPTEKTDIKSLKDKIAKLNQEISRLREKNEALRSEKKILDEILDNLPGTFYIWDDRPQLIRWNRRHEEITEYSGDDYPNMFPTDFSVRKNTGQLKLRLIKCLPRGRRPSKPPL